MMSAFVAVFWEVTASILTWQFWLVGIVSLVAILAVNGLMAAGMLVPLGGFIAVPVMMLAPSIIITIGIMLLMPMMVLREPGLGWNAISHLGMLEIGKIAFFSLIATIAAAFVPIVGRSSSLSSVVQAAVVLSLSLAALAGGALDVIPDFLTIFVMAGALAIGIWLLSLAFVFPLMLLTGGNDDAMSTLGLIAGAPFSYLAAATYAGWIRVENFG